jgi:RNA polymerase sigma factor (sigma-70 family)
MYHDTHSRHDLPQPHLVEPDPCVLLATRRPDYLAYLRRRIKDPGTAEDVFQDFSVKVILAARRSALIGNTDAWLARVLRNTLFDHYRRRDARRRAEAAYAGHLEALATPAAAESGRTEALSAEADIAAVEAALANILPNHADLIRALYLRGRPRDTLALELDVDVGTLNVRAFRARRALRDEVERLAAGFLAVETPASVSVADECPRPTHYRVRGETNRMRGVRR